MHMLCNANLGHNESEMICPSRVIRRIAMEAFLIGVPKAGTTWLSHVLDQHPGIDLSSPKEPNFIATHKGTFERVVDEPVWAEYGGFFSGNGVKIDASVHTFACPVAPSRIKSKFPNAKFILCLREPVSRTVSHWNMIRNSGEGEEENRNWEVFEEAWLDDSLRVDSMYGTSMENWLEEFGLDRFTIIDSSRMRSEPIEVIREIEDFLGVDKWEYDLRMGRHENSAASNRRVSVFGNIAMLFFSLIPKIIKAPIIRFLQFRDWNIYRLPILSEKGEYVPLGESHYLTCGEELCKELVIFGKLTGFDCSNWESRIRSYLHEETD